MSTIKKFKQFFLKNPKYSSKSEIHPSLFTAWHGAHLQKRKTKKIFFFISLFIILNSLFVIYSTLSPKPKIVHADSLIKFDEGFGASVNDANSSISAGTITNAVWKAEELCQSGKCLFFDGTQDYVSFADDADLDFAAADSFSVSFWFRHAPKTSGTEVMVVKLEAVGTDGGYQIQMEADGDITCQIEDDDADTTIDDSVSSTAATYDDNQWHYVSCVKSGTSSLTLYIDAVQIAQDAALDASSTLANNDTFYIGIDGDGTSNDFTGFIDEVKVYRSARTASDIKADYTGTTKSRGTAAKFAPDQSFLSDGLVGYWKMDDAAVDTEGESSTDSSGNGNTGTLYGDNGVGDNGTGMNCTASGKFGTGCNFDGTDDYVNLGNSSILNPTRITITAWIKFNSIPYTNQIAIDRSASYRLIDPDVNSSKLSARFATTNVNWGNGTLAGNTTLSANTWYHVAFTYDGSYARVWLNGIEDGSVAASGDLVTANGNNIIGNYNDLIQYWFNGSIDDVRIYNRALSGAEVSQLYNWAPGQLGYWKMDEVTANTCTGGANDSCDSSGFGYDGAWNGNAASTKGKFGPGVTFDGTGDYVDAGDIGL